MVDIIGTPVKRVIPDGWSIQWNGTVQEGDVIEGDNTCNVWTIACDAVGDVITKGRWHGHLVIRRNAPEPSVEDVAALKAQIERLQAKEEARKWWVPPGEVTRLEADKDELKAKVAELERLRGVECERADNYSNLLEASRDKVAELEKEAEKWKGEWTLARNKHQGALDAKDAEIERLTISAADLLARNADLADEVEKWEGRCDDAEAKDVKIKQLNADVTMWADASQRNLKRADDAEAKLYAVKKAMEGA